MKEGFHSHSQSYECLSSSSYLLRWDCCVHNLVPAAAPICLSIPLYPHSRTRHHGARNLSLGGTIPKNTWTSSYPCKNNGGSKFLYGKFASRDRRLKMACLNIMFRPYDWIYWSTRPEAVFWTNGQNLNAFKSSRLNSNKSESRHIFCG